MHPGPPVALRECSVAVACVLVGLVLLQPGELQAQMPAAERVGSRVGRHAKFDRLPRARDPRPAVLAFHRRASVVAAAAGQPDSRSVSERKLPTSDPQQAGGNSKLAEGVPGGGALATLSGDENCDSRVMASIDGTRTLIQHRRWREADRELERVEALCSCSTDPSRALLRVADLYREAFRAQAAKRIYEAVSATAPSERIRTVGEYRLESLEGPADPSFPATSRVAHMIRWDWLSIDEATPSGVMVDTAIRQVIRRLVLVSVCLGLLLVGAAIRLGRKLTWPLTRAFLVRTIGPLLGFWILLDGIPFAMAVAAYSMRRSLTLNPFVIICMIPYALSAGLITLLAIRRGTSDAATPGNRATLKWGAYTAVVASAIGLAIVMIRHRPDVPLMGGDTGYLTLSIVSFPLVAFVEEFVYRRCLWGASRAVLGGPMAAIISSGVFAAAHGSVGGWLLVLFGAGEACRAAYERLGGLRGAVVTHWLFNAVVSLVQIASR